MESNHNSEYDQLNRYKYIINNIKDVIWELNSDFAFTFVSPNGKSISGYEPEEMLGRKIPEFLVEDSKQYFYEQVSRRINNPTGGGEKIVLHDVQFVCKDGTVKWVEVSANIILEEGRFIGYIGTTRDISEKKEYESRLNEYILELKAMNAELKKMATTDNLTGAYNRRKFDDDLNLIIRKKEKHDITFSLIFIDVDHFKSVNDRFGHKKGDHVLRRLSELVSKNIRTTDRLFRWGGEEFIVLLPGADLECAKVVATKIKDIIHANDFGIDMNISVSLGIGEYIANENADQVVSRLDKTLYQAKARGGNRVEY